MFCSIMYRLSYYNTYWYSVYDLVDNKRLNIYLIFDILIIAMNPKIYKGQQVQMIDTMGNVRFTKVSEVRNCGNDENIIVYLTNGMTLRVNEEDTIYSTYGTIFKFI